MNRSLGPILIIGLMGLFPCGPYASAQSSMSAQEIQANIIGNTISGMEHNERYAEYLSPDGRILGRAESGPYSGTWHIEGDQLCVFYLAQEQGENTWECATLKLNGNQLVWVEPNSGDFVTTLSKGNTEYLKFLPISQKE